MREVGAQCRRDWFGKDVQETPTVSYVWTADQFGHFGLGFQITLALVAAASLLPARLGWVAAWAPAANMAVWAIKEAFDYLRERRNARAAASSFAFDARELCWNIATALFYIGCGIAVAAAGLRGLADALAVLLALLVLAVPCAVWWLRRKITFQQAGLPYLYRLANFPPNLDNATAVAGLYATAGTPAVRHLVIAGPAKAGKTSLAVGVGTEFAFRLGIGRYTSLVKLLQANGGAGPGTATEFDDGRILWPWQGAALLIVDDVDSAGDIAAALTGAAVVAEPPIAQVSRALQTCLSPGVIAGMVSRRTIWVVGDTDPAPWRDMLRKVFNLSPSSIIVVQLRETVAEVLAGRRRAAAAPH